MNGLRYFRAFSPLVLCTGLLLFPDPGQAQSTEAVREREIQAKLGELEALQEARMARIQEALAKARAELESQEAHNQEALAARMAEIEAFLAQYVPVGTTGDAFSMRFQKGGEKKPGQKLHVSTDRRKNLF